MFVANTLRSKEEGTYLSRLKLITNFLFNHDMRMEAHCSAVTFM